MLPWFFIAVSFFYLLCNLSLLYGWRKWKKNKAKAPFSTFVSVIIAVRNEEDHIIPLLASLQNQSYPKDHFEVIVIDDHSEDNTFDTVKAFKRESSLGIRLLHLDKKARAPKKAAIERGVRLSKGELILVTDGDCTAGKRWVESMVSLYAATGAKFVAGPVTFAEKATFVNRLLTIEFASLIGSGAALLYFKKPVMCNAANLAFDKKTFLEVDGFRGNENQASGDDVFLMRKIFDRYPERVVFNKDPESSIKTLPEPTASAFYHQRVRWAAKWSKVKGIENQLIPVTVFLFHLLMLAAPALVALGKLSAADIVVVILARFSGEYLFLRDVMKFSNRKASIVHYFIASLAYSFYAVFIGVAANISRYSWKGRKYFF